MNYKHSICSFPLITKVLNVEENWATPYKLKYFKTWETSIATWHSSKYTDKFKRVHFYR